MLMSFAPGLRDRPRRALAADRDTAFDRAPEIGQLEAEDHVRAGDELARAVASG